MLVCLACFENRLASVFETATELRLYRLDDTGICPAGRLPLPSKDPMDTLSATLACGASLLVCGAMCRDNRRRLESAGITVRGLISGEVDAVVAALAENRLRSLAAPACTLGLPRPAETT